MRQDILQRYKARNIERNMKDYISKKYDFERMKKIILFSEKCLDENEAWQKMKQKYCDR